MSSLWIERSSRPSPTPLPGSGGSYDVVVLGGGLTGLVTALLFARAGCAVAVVEGRRIGDGTTGHSTAKISLLQGTRLSEIARRHGLETSRAYVDANLEGQQWLLSYCAEHEVPVQRRDALTYAASPELGQLIEAEHTACRTAGLGTERIDDAGLPFATFGALRLAGQAQVDPMELLLALVADLRRHGADVFEQTRATALRTRGGPLVRTRRGDLSADHVVVATGTPVFDRGGYFARLSPDRSYSMAFRTPEPAVDGMFLSAGDPKRSLRTAPDGDGSVLLVGGNGHVTGRASHPGARIDELRRWTTDRFPGAEFTHAWSGQDYSTASGLPYVGPLVPGDERVLVATGFHKWGFANAVAAALAISSTVLGSQAPWSMALSAWTSRELASAGRVVGLNASVGMELTRGWLEAFHRPKWPGEGDGFVGIVAGKPTATSTVGGRTRSVSAVCSHLGGVLRWNDAECSWDCPLHGSRFDPDGELLEGPATGDLRRLD